MKNPFCKRTENLTEQGKLLRDNPAMYEQLKKEAIALDAEADRMERTRSLAEFNELEKAEKIRFIQSGGVIE